MCVFVKYFTILNPIIGSFNLSANIVNGLYLPRGQSRHYLSDMLNVLSSNTLLACDTVCTQCAAHTRTHTRTL